MDRASIFVVLKALILYDRKGENERKLRQGMCSWDFGGFMVWCNE